MTEVTDNDVRLARIIRNGLLIGVLGMLLIMASCSVANWHYDQLRYETAQQAETTRYLVTRPW